MVSEARRINRYKRRQRKRLQRKIDRCNALGSLEDICTYNKLYKTGKKCCRNIRWKSSTQNFERHLFSITAVQRKAVLEGRVEIPSYRRFHVMERGVDRMIDAPPIKVRQIQKLLVKEILLPLYMPQLIYRNGAGLPNKGYKFVLTTLKNDLQDHFKKYGKDGWIILLDIKKFFPSVPHKLLYQQHENLIFNEDLKHLADINVGANNSTGVGMFLGVESGQIEMVAATMYIDSYICSQLGLGKSRHYADDYSILVPPDRDPVEMRNKIVQTMNEAGFQINLHKSKIVPLHKSFRFCKVKFTLKDDGNVIMGCNKTSLPRARQKMKYFKKRYDEGSLDIRDICAACQSMISYFANFDEYWKIYALEKLFISLFVNKD